MKTKKRFLSILLSLILLLGVLTVPAIADYTVEFTRGELQYVLPGNGSQQLSVILDKVGLVGEVTDVSVSNEGLFSVSHEAGEWIVDSHQAFKTTEWMRVTVGGVEYEITVTDDPGSAYAGTLLTDAPVGKSSHGYFDYYKLGNGTYYIDEDTTISHAILVESVNAVINLNGHTLRLANDADNTVIYVWKGTLTLNGDGGKITGGTGSHEIRDGYTGWQRGGGVSIDFDSNVTLNDVGISGNSASFGGGIFINGPGGDYSGNSATCVLNNCTITSS